MKVSGPPPHVHPGSVLYHLAKVAPRVNIPAQMYLFDRSDVPELDCQQSDFEQL